MPMLGDAESSSPPLPSRFRDNPAFGLFLLRDFRLLWTAALAQLLGYWLQRLSVAWLVLKLTGSPVLVGLSFSLYGAPLAVCGPLSGTVVGRVNKNRFLMSVHGMFLCSGLSLAVQV